MPDCQKVCVAVAAADLNGDGIDEFILQVDAGASTDFFHIYELPASEAFGRPSVVAPPGSQRWPPDARIPLISPRSPQPAAATW